MKVEFNKNLKTINVNIRKRVIQVLDDVFEKLNWQMIGMSQPPVML